MPRGWPSSHRGLRPRWAGPHPAAKADDPTTPAVGRARTVASAHDGPVRTRQRNVMTQPAEPAASPLAVRVEGQVAVEGRESRVERSGIGEADARKERPLLPARNRHTPQNPGRPRYESKAPGQRRVTSGPSPHRGPRPRWTGPHPAAKRDDPTQQTPPPHPWPSGSKVKSRWRDGSQGWSAAESAKPTPAGRPLLPARNRHTPQNPGRPRPPAKAPGHRRRRPGCDGNGTPPSYRGEGGEHHGQVVVWRGGRGG